METVIEFANALVYCNSLMMVIGYCLRYRYRTVGEISFDEFSLWWRAQEVTYTIKRSDVVPPILTNPTYGGVSTAVSRVSNPAGGGRSISRGIYFFPLIS
jgi:hypothetical protein